MTIIYPITLPSQDFRSVRMIARDVVGVAESPFSLKSDVQVFSGQRWEADYALPPLRTIAVAAPWVAALTSLKGRGGTFLASVDPLCRVPRGTWAGSPLVMGAHSAGASSVIIDGFSAGATVKAMDYVQFGTGASSRLYQVLKDASEAAGAITLDIWPNLSIALLDNAALVLIEPRGVFRLANNSRSWDLGTFQMYSVSFSAVSER